MKMIEGYITYVFRVAVNGKKNMVFSWCLKKDLN